MTTRRPRLGRRPDWTFPVPVTATLDTGLRVWAFHLPGQYVVSAGINFDIPLTVEPARLEGIAATTLHTIDEGTVSHPGTGFTAALEGYGAVVGGAALLSGTQFGLEVPVTTLVRALPLMVEALTEPAFAPDDVRRRIGLRMAEIEQIRANSAHLAGALTPGLVFADSSRASRPAGGSRTTVSSITTDEVRAFHADHYSPVGATLVLAGDFAGLDPLVLAEQAFGSWTNPRAETPAAAPSPAAPVRRLIGRPGAAQADLRIAAPTITRTDPRWSALQVACSIVGGAFQSRLNTVLRERRGYTYGVHLAAHPLRDVGYLAVTGSFRTEVVPAALEEARTLLDVARKPFSRRETTRAISQLTATAPMRYSTASAVAQQALSLATNGLDTAYVDLHLARTRTVTAEQATEVFLDCWPADPALLVVGDPALAEPLGLPAEPIPEL